VAPAREPGPHRQTQRSTRGPGPVSRQDGLIRPEHAPAVKFTSERALALEFGTLTQLADPQRQADLIPGLQLGPFFRESHKFLRRKSDDCRNVRQYQLDRNGLNRGVGLCEAIACPSQAYLVSRNSARASWI